MTRKHLFAIIPFLLGVTSLIAYQIIGSEVSSDGTLIEPFGLIPIGYFLITVGIIASIVLFVRSFFKNK